jgi:hypothetical protein
VMDQEGGMARARGVSQSRGRLSMALYGSGVLHGMARPRGGIRDEISQKAGRCRGDYIR